MKKTMAYKHKGMKHMEDTKGTCSPKEFDKKASMAPATKPSMKHNEPSGPYSMPKGGEQSMAPSHKKTALPMKDAPKGVSAPNGGSSVSMPKGGGVGDTEV